MDLFSLISLGVGLFSSTQAKKGNDEARLHYNQQAEINRQMGNFNESVAIMTGEQQATAIHSNTVRLLGQQKALFLGRGLETTGGSPMMILGETETMGTQRMQEAFFNSSVEGLNARYNTMSTVSKLDNAASQHKYGAIGNVIDFTKQVLGIRQSNASAKAVGETPRFNIFDFWR